MRRVNDNDIAGMSLRTVQQMLAGSGAFVELTLERTRGLPTNVMHVTVEAIEVCEVDTDESDEMPPPADDAQPPAAASAAEAEAAVRAEAAASAYASAAADAQVIVGSSLSLLDQMMLQDETGYDAAEKPRLSVSNSQTNLDRTRTYSALMRI